MLHALLLLAVPAQLNMALPADSIEKLKDRARGAEARFERMARTLAPLTWGGSYGSDCDEIVGRFCLRFDSTTSTPSSKETGVVVDARREAVEAIRRYYSAAPAALHAAGPLVRLLVQDDRAREAVSAARTFMALSRDSLWGNLLLGLALHATQEEDEAERHFARALQRMDPVRRREWIDPRWLQSDRERGAVRRLSPEARLEYERKFWLVSDPFWLTAANEYWVEHLTRHTESRLLEDVPLVHGMVSWGRDLDELTVRYGTPTARARTGGGFGVEESMVEYYDTAQRLYAPDQFLAAGFSEPPFPGTKPLLYSARARAGYALRRVNRVLHLTHQLTRFVEGNEAVFRVDAAVETPADSLPPSFLQAGLFVYDSALTRRAEQLQSQRWSPDSTRVTLLTRAAPGAVIYSVEMLDTIARFGARARHAVDAGLPLEGPIVSDLLICAPFPSGQLPQLRDDPLLQARTSLVFAPGDTIGIYAEAYRVSSPLVRVELGLEPANGPGALSRLGRWVGRSLGLVGPRTDPRVSWSAPRGTGGVQSLAVNLPLEARRRGQFMLLLRVTDNETGRTTETRRPILIR